MVLRSWRGAVRPEDAARYLEHQAGTGVAAYRRTEGNLGAFALSRPCGDLVEVLTLSLWTSMDAVRAFAGDEPGRARFFPGDDELLVERDLHVDHFDVAGLDIGPGLLGGHGGTAGRGPA